MSAETRLDESRSAKSSPAKPAADRTRDDYLRMFHAGQIRPDTVADLALGLHNAGKYPEVVALIEAAMLSGQTQPWMYDVLAGSMKLTGRPQAEIDRVLLSRVDFTAMDVPHRLFSAAHLMRCGSDAEALRMYRQASRFDPTRADPYLLGLKAARKLEDVAGVEWAVTGILTYSWPHQFERQHNRAVDVAADLARKLRQAGRTEEAAHLAEVTAEARRIDLTAELTWVGDGDLDLLVEEPLGTACSASSPRTTSGGFHIKDGYGPKPDNCKEQYFCPVATPGRYRLRVRHVSGGVVGKRANLTVRTGVGTKDATQKSFAVQLGMDDTLIPFELAEGRRNEPMPIGPNSLQPTVVRPGQGLSRLGRPGSHNLGSENLARLTAQGMLPPPPKPFVLAQFQQSSQQSFVSGANPVAGGGSVGYQPQISLLSEGVPLTAGAVVSGDRRYVRLSLSPTFSTITDVATFSFANTGGR